MGDGGSKSLRKIYLQDRVKVYTFPVLVRITLDKAASSSYDNDDWNDDDYDDDDEEDYTPSSKPSSGSGSSQSVNAGDVYEAIRLINAERKKNGLNELEVDSELMSMAAVRAEELAETFGHVRPDGTGYETIYTEFGSALRHNGEIAAAGLSSASREVDGWIKSSAHHEIMLRDNSTKMGVGYYYDSNSEWKHYWVTLFAK